MENWDKAIAVLSKFENADDPKIIRDLGIALCKKYEKTPGNRKFIRGQELLLKAGSPPHNIADALSSLAETLKGINDKKSGEYYRRAYELDPTDANPLGNYLEFKIVGDKNLSIIDPIKPIINKAIQRCKACIDVGVNIPWAYYDIAKLNLLLGESYFSLSSFAKAIELSTAPFMLETYLTSVQRFALIKDLIIGYDYIENFLLLGLATKFDKVNAKKEIRKRSLSKRELKKPSIVILAGGSNEKDGQKMEGYSKLLLDTFEGYKGIIISGGTKSGISKLAGDVKEKYPKNIYTIGYIPGKPSIKIDKNPKRYNKIYKTKGEEFSPLEATQYWIDIISSGVNPQEVKLLVVGGGKISESECKFALTLGAKVGIVEGSGGDTFKLFSDTDWNTSNNLILLPPDAVIIKSFIKSEIKEMDHNLRELLAKDIHRQFQEVRKKVPETRDPSLASWENLQENLKESSRQQADQIFEKLNLIGCAVREIKDREIAIMKFSKREIEMMAEMEHARWVVERLSDGWKLAKTKDVTKKLSPYLISWNQLSEDIKDLDRITVIKIPEYLADVGLEVYRNSIKA